MISTTDDQRPNPHIQFVNTKKEKRKVRSEVHSNLVIFRSQITKIRSKFDIVAFIDNGGKSVAAAEVSRKSDITGIESNIYFF